MFRPGNYITFNVYGELPEDTFFSPTTLQRIINNQPIVQTIDLMLKEYRTWVDLKISDKGICTEIEYTLKPCCRKQTYICRNRKGKLYLLVAKEI